MTSTEISEQDITALIARWSEAAQLIMNGDLRAYAAIARHAEDFTLLPPNGGDARSGFDGSDEAVEWWARTFRGGQAELEVLRRTAQAIWLCWWPSNGKAEQSATYRRRTGHCASPWFSVAKEQSGASCIDMPTRLCDQ